jgi:hypothetical protein
MTRSSKDDDSTGGDHQTGSAEPDDQRPPIREHMRKVLLSLHAFMEAQRTVREGSSELRVQSNGEKNGS